MANVSNMHESEALRSRAEARHGHDRSVDHASSSIEMSTTVSPVRDMTPEDQWRRAQAFRAGACEPSGVRDAISYVTTNVCLSQWDAAPRERSATPKTSTCASTRTLKASTSWWSKFKRGLERYVPPLERKASGPLRGRVRGSPQHPRGRHDRPNGRARTRDGWEAPHLPRTGLGMRTCGFRFDSLQELVPAAGLEPAPRCLA